jgi:hypothetical protein
MMTTATTPPAALPAIMPVLEWEDDLTAAVGDAEMDSDVLLVEGSGLETGDGDGVGAPGVAEGVPVAYAPMPERVTPGDG